MRLGQHRSWMAGTFVVFLGLASGHDAFAQSKKKKTPPTAPVEAPKAAAITPTGNNTEDLDKAEQLYAATEYESAHVLAIAATKKGGMTHADLVRGYRTLALCSAFIDDEDGAREAFVALLQYDPDFQADPNLGPRVTRPFFSARGYWRGMSQKPGLDVAVTSRAKEDGIIRVTLRDPTHVVKKLTVGYRFAMTGSFEVETLKPGEASAVELAPPPALATRLDYYAQAFDEKENVVFELGNGVSPKTLVIEAQPEKAPGKSGSVFSSPFFWVGAGAVLAGGGVAAYFLLRQKDPTSAELRPQTFCGYPATFCQ